jgi:hypothetical protein
LLTGSPSGSARTTPGKLVTADGSVVPGLSQASSLPSLVDREPMPCRDEP